MAKYSPPDVPFVEALHKGGKQHPTFIVINLSGTTSDKGAALGIANNWHKRSSPMFSSHYVVDESQTIRCVWDRVVALHNGDEHKGGLVLNVCAAPVDFMDVWQDSSRIRALARTADLVAELLLAYRIPVRYLTEKPRLRLRSSGGILVQVQGHWPYQDFINNVQLRIEAAKAQRKVQHGLQSRRGRPAGRSLVH